MSPLVSIVTPSLNAAAYLEQALDSVFRQGYACIEYLVVDGGSRDGTLELLRRYEGRLSYLSAPDRGPAEAINLGFRLTRGEIFAWLSADDYYLPGAVAAAVRQLAANPAAGVVYGEAEWVDESGRRLGDYPTGPFDPRRLARECFIAQPAAFLRREAFQAAGGLDPRWPHTFDYDLWIRLAQRFPFTYVRKRLAASRMHRRSITLGARRQVLEENIRLLRHHFGYAPFSWIYALCAHRLDRRDQFFEPLRPSAAAYALSLPVGIFCNRRHPARYLREWRSAMTPSAWRRLFRSLLPW